MSNSLASKLRLKVLSSSASAVQLYSGEFQAEVPGTYLHRNDALAYRDVTRLIITQAVNGARVKCVVINELASEKFPIS